MINRDNYSGVPEPVSERFITAEQVVKLTQEQYKNITRIDFAPPAMGSGGFGKFKVTYRNPVLCERNR